MKNIVFIIIVFAIILIVMMPEINAMRRSQNDFEYQMRLRDEHMAKESWAIKQEEEARKAEANKKAGWIKTATGFFMPHTTF